MNSPVNLQQLKQTAKLPARQAGIGSVKKFFDSQKNTLTAVLPKHVNADRMLKIALGALRTTPKLMECTTETLFGAIVQCSQLGLEPNTPLGHAYLIPFKNSRKNVTEVQIVFGYKGLIDLARRSGQIVSISAHAVHENDKFSYAYGLEEKLEHVPAKGERGEVIYFYAVAKLVGGGHAFEVMPREDIEAIRNSSSNYKFAQDKGSTVWGQHFIQMGRKTVLRRLFNYLPVSIEVATASALDSKSAMGEDQNMGAVLDGDFNVVDDEHQHYTGHNDDEPQHQSVEHSQAEPSQQQGPSELFQDALSAAKSGDRDMALDLCRSLTDDEAQVIRNTLNQAESRNASSEQNQGSSRGSSRAGGMSME
ncbi:recombination protein RecT [Aliidiomarina maris]|uniref:Recombinase RecT n=1 Tax=Aliidiomarina maris TaxID=531312 RepID=A0A327X6X2_9GAMM|nr:recombination protein RecT [Aliidiomarina maris]RAK01643.1 recombination protein RecT [Aliidiomarina maris]RUO28467.1 recombinase RecT [Aliidiomarina maris]